MNMKVWIDGEIMDAERARVSVLDHGFLYGDGVFEGIRVHGGQLFRLDDHLTRLTHGARALGLRLPGGPAGLRSAVEQTVAAYGEEHAYVRLIVSRGDGPLGIDPESCPEPRVVCIAAQLKLYGAARERGVAMITASVRRPGADVLDPRIKTLNYLNNILAKQQARAAGADEALLLNGSGHVAEASAANVFVARDGVLHTPPTTDGALDGITRKTVLELARAGGVPVAERTLGRMDVLAADEVFLTGTGAGLVRVGSLDGAVIGRGEPGPLFERLGAGYAARVAAGDGATNEP